MLRDLTAPIWKIPRGKVATYGEVARAAGFPRHARQVAWALRGAHGAIPHEYGDRPCTCQARGEQYDLPAGAGGISERIGAARTGRFQIIDTAGAPAFPVATEKAGVGLHDFDGKRQAGLASGGDHQAGGTDGRGSGHQRFDALRGSGQDAYRQYGFAFADDDGGVPGRPETDAMNLKPRAARQRTAR